MTHSEYTKWNYKEFGQEMSVAGLWSYRGFLWKKYAGKYPTPEEVGLAPDHWFFDADFVDTAMTYDYNGKLKKVEHFHRGKKIKPSHRLYPK